MCALTKQVCVAFKILKHGSADRTCKIWPGCTSLGPKLGCSEECLSRGVSLWAAPRVHITPSCLDRNQSLVLACSMRGRYGP